MGSGVQRQLGTAAEYPVRFREDKPADLDRARREVAAWREQHPHGTADELIEAVGLRFHPHYAVVLRGVLFAVDQNRAYEVTGTAAGTEAGNRRTAPTRDAAPSAYAAADGLTAPGSGAAGTAAR
jgi:hypothetical protein